MDPQPVLNAIGVLGASLCTLLALFLLVADGPLRKANRYLAGFLLLTAVDLSGWASGLLPPGLRDWMTLRLPLAFVQMPLLYAYAVALCFPARWSRGHLVGGLLAGLASLLVLLPGTAWSAGADDGIGFGMRASQAGLHVQFYLYIALMVRLLARYRTAYHRAHSNPGTLTFRWLAVVTGVSLVAHTLVLAKSVAWMDERAATAITLELVVATLAVLILAAMTLAALLRQELFLGVTVELESPPAAGPVDTDDQSDRLALSRLGTFMERESPYLDPSLTIRSLSRRLGLGQRELSRLINQRLGVHFFDFVNRYRVDRAAALLADRAHHDVSVLDIALQSGFNSKSSFNTAFGKHRGMTPSAYRRSAAAHPMATGTGRNRFENRQAIDSQGR